MSEACQNCGQVKTTRNARYFTTFLDKPLCARWKACYKRKTGKTIRQRGPRRRPRMSIADAIAYTKLANEQYARRLKLEHEHGLGAHRGAAWDDCPLCKEVARKAREQLEESNRQAREVYEQVLRDNGMLGAH